MKRIAPLRRGKSHPGADLVSMLAEHEARCADEAARVTGAAVKAVLERGLAAWPGRERTTLTREQWAKQRVQRFLSVAAGDAEPEGYRRDLGLLSKSHPAHPQHKADAAPERADMVTVSADEVARHLAMFDAE